MLFDITVGTDDPKAKFEMLIIGDSKPEIVGASPLVLCSSDRYYLYPPILECSTIGLAQTAPGLCHFIMFVFVGNLIVW